MTQRYSPSIKVDDAKVFIHIVSLMQLGKMDEAFQSMKDNAVALGNLGGAMDSQLPPPAVVVQLGTVPATGTNFPLSSVDPGIVYQGTAGGAGKWSGSVSSGQPVLLFTVNGVDYADPAPCLAGDIVSLRLKDGMPAASGGLYSIVP